MYAGKLRHRLVIESASGVQDTFGEESTDDDGDWQAEGTVWGLVEPLSGTELFEARQATPEVSHRVTLRYRDNLTPDKRIRWGERIFGILTVINSEERKRQLVVTCREIVKLEDQ